MDKGKHHEQPCHSSEGHCNGGGAYQREHVSAGEDRRPDAGGAGFGQRDLGIVQHGGGFESVGGH